MNYNDFCRAQYKSQKQMFEKDIAPQYSIDKSDWMECLKKAVSKQHKWWIFDYQELFPFYERYMREDFKEERVRLITAI